MKKLLKTPYFYLSAIALILAALLPFPFPQYKIYPTFKVFNTDRLKRTYCDFDNDGVSEFIRLHSSNTLGSDGMRMVVTDIGGNLIYRTILDANAGSYSMDDEFLLEDIDNSGYKSAAMFTRGLDSLYLSVFRFTDTSMMLSGVPLLPINDPVEQIFVMRWLGNYINHKGEIVLYFYMDESMTMNGLTIYSYNLSSRQLNLKRFDAINPQLYFIYSGSNEPQILLNTVSNTSLSDDYAWEYAEVPCQLILLNTNLQFVNDPVVLADRYTYADVKVLRSESGELSFFSYVWNFGETNKSPGLIKFNSEGDKLFTILLNYTEQFKYLELIDHGNNQEDLYLVTENYQYYKLNTANGELSKPINTSICLDGLQYITSSQLDNKEFIEYIFYDNDMNELVVMRKNYSQATHYNIMDENLEFDKLDIRHGDVFQIVLPGEVYFNRLSYEPTSWIWLKYPIWFAIIALINLIVWFRYQLKQKRQLRLKAIERKITDLQLKNFRNQLDPHFTFNALNVIGSVIYKEDRDVAYDYFTRFTRLMRSSLADSTKTTRELQAELQFTSDYLEFQKYRFKDKFDFEIKVDEDIDLNMPIPKMLIQGYAENSVRHGFNMIKYKGKIEINISKGKDGETLVVIKDNGIGREAAANLRQDTRIGRGMNVMEEQINLFNNYNSRSIKLEVVDLEKDAKPAGTEIRIIIPKGYSFSISKK